MQSLLGVIVLAICLSASCRESVEPNPPVRVADFPELGAPNYEGLVSAVWVKSLLEFHASSHAASHAIGRQAPRPATYRNNRFIILEASWAKPERATEYLQGHIPGAIHFNTDDLETGYPRWMLRPVEELQQVVGRYGITPQTTVVVYGNQLIAAARVWWALKYAGVADVRLLDGGYGAWTADGFGGETTVRTPQPASFSAPVRADFLATTEYVRANYDSANVWLADARAVEEFQGTVSGYEYVDFKGRIPSALNIGNADDGSFLYKRRDGRLRGIEEIRAMWRSQGIVSTNAAQAKGLFDREVVFYCGSGWRSSVAFFYAWLMGYRNIRNYSDGWIGWSTVYSPDMSAGGSTPGWRQTATGNPVAGSAVLSGSIDSKE